MKNNNNKKLWQKPVISCIPIKNHTSGGSNAGKENGGHPLNRS
jgi:hypothetical protein